MNWRLISLPLIVFSVLLYHLAQKNIPKHVNPVIALAVAYAIASVLCLAILYINDEIKTGIIMLRSRDWLPLIFLGLTLIPVELGFLYAYRTGWKISTTAITTSSATTILLALLGVLWFKEQLSLTNLVGVGLCIMGVICANIK